MGSNKILVVEDERDNRNIISIYVKGIGFDAIAVSNGSEALKTARAVLPDLILMDLALPGITGDHVIAELKSDSNTRHIPIFIISALPETNEVFQSAIAAGADEVFSKPFSFKELGDAIHRYFPGPDIAES